MPEVTFKIPKCINTKKKIIIIQQNAQYNINEKVNSSTFLFIVNCVLITNKQTKKSINGERNMT